MAIFDLRAGKPLAVKDHMYGEPIRSVQFHQLPGDSGVWRQPGGCVTWGVACCSEQASAACQLRSPFQR